MRSILALLAMVAATNCSAVKVIAPSSKDIGVNHELVLRYGGAVEWPAGSSGKDVRGLLFRACGHAHATLLCLHGIQTHAGWFAPLAAHLTAQGINVLAMDRRGSGMNSASFPIGDAANAQQLLDDLELQLREAGRLGVPVYLAGTSWGSNLAAVHVLRGTGTQPAGLIQVVPATKSFFEPFYKTHLLAPAVALFAPESRQEVPFKPGHYQAGSLQPDVRTGCAPDACARHSQPVIHKENKGLTDLLNKDAAHHALVEAPTVRLMRAGLSLASEWRKPAGHISQPMLLIVADRDQIMNNHEAWKAAEAHTDDTSHQLTLKPLHTAGHGAQITDANELSHIISEWITGLPSHRGR